MELYLRHKKSKSTANSIRISIRINAKGIFTKIVQNRLGDIWDI
ncbi:Putative uncharacterized protein [Moritella viscosa]|uniref:Uncharacterized protein n=1 Tax=Moritella viscosa TaxID=80854 RepID=A0A1L0AUR6_9GAMM|nr:Putative uncharacterized protein [Moritella viscosa]SHO15177.1 Putative uncharacterized protein [Moritella viscosa]SHO15506.1 Putative uncharacterized protein [Moritella viscosa]SHO17347.1 Putative uncharacterized protein [Moritella viscosa]SHO19005.1 Putative uncharacterized protein [Moritella viscosa]